MKGPNYPIRAVAKLTGLSVDTLRAWERRYEAVRPKRDERGRLYSKNDVKRLHLLRTAVGRGHSIGRVAGLADRELASLIADSDSAAYVAEGGKTGAGQSKLASLESLLEAIERFDYSRAERELQRLAVLLSSRELIYDVVVPLMHTVGQYWYRGLLTIAQEHMVSALLRNLLGSLIRLYQGSNASRDLLFATVSGEQHEFGILSAAMLAARGGLGVVYLGPNLPAKEIALAAKRTAVRVVALGVVAAEGGRRTKRELQRVFDELPAGTELWVGGAKAEALASEMKGSGILFLSTLGSMEPYLNRLGARI